MRNEVGGRLECRVATADDRERIYALRDEVYARELGQHEPSPEGRLTDALDASNVYFVVAKNTRVEGFISVTPPSAPSYSIDKYFARSEVPLAFDDGLFEIRILTVPPGARGRVATELLLFAALRHVEEAGGRHVVILGRADLRSFYERFGCAPLGRGVRAGRVRYELMAGPVRRIARIARGEHRDVLRRAARYIDWNLPFPFALDGTCEHGGASASAVSLLDRPARQHAHLVPADVLDAWFPPAPSVVEALRDDPAWIARTAPPTNADALRAALATTLAVPEACLALGAGSSDLIFRAFTAWLAPDVRALVPDPTYGEYAHVLEHVVGARVDRFELPRDRGFALDVHAWAERVAEGGYDVAVLVNPNNPTGSVVEREALIAALERIPTTTLVWIDEAYSCYAHQPTSVITHAPSRPGLVACRSLSKAYALSGLRIAIACAREDLAEELRARTPPWIVGLPAQVAAIAALGEGEYYAARHSETAELRERLVDRLRRLGLAVSTGCLNAVLVRLPAPLPDAATATHLARREGVFVRDLTGLSAAFPGRTIRVAVRSEAENERIAEVFAHIVERAR